MISVVIPTLNAQDGLAATLASLVPGAVEGLVGEVIIADGGSDDLTGEIAEAMGAVIVRAPRGRGSQLATGAQAAKNNWLFFLHADTTLESGWVQEIASFIERVDGGARLPAAAAFRFALDDIGFTPRYLEAMVRLRCLVWRMPYGDQGLLIPAALYRAVGGYKDMPLMEDVDLIRRLDRAQRVMLRSRAITAATRYRRDGYIKRVGLNLFCLMLYFLKVPPERLRKIYG